MARILFVTLQPMRSITLPAELQPSPAPNPDVSVDPNALCGEDKNCTVH